ncbi:hypothetical protein [Pseudoduganella violaceinigra]|uniref:hypothetical protein n=1 Tax=Pseudoduganella violaceinigra TaxID=246602 RepID=UPI0012B50C55|nr:hypothetical protein [Pseudoduganella violaceinigra]
MKQQEMNSDVLVRLSHMSLWMVLLTILYAGGAMLLLLLGGPKLAEAARSAMILLPVMNAIALGALRMKAGKGSCARSPQMRAVMNDELRQLALSKGYRNGFFASMISTVAIAPILSFAGVQGAPAVMMVVVATTGVAAMLGSVLYYDR